MTARNRRPATVIAAVIGSLVAAGLGGCDRTADDEARAAAIGAESGPPRRIVSTMPSTTEMLAAMGAWDRVVGVSRFCDVPPEARDLPAIGSGMDPDLERILSLRPDLVVGTVAQSGYPFVAALQEAGVPVFLVSDESLDRLYGGMLGLGRAIGEEASARREVDRIRGELAELRRSTAALEPKRVLLVFDADPVYAAGPDTLISELLEAAGGRNVVRQGDWVQLDREQVIQLSPEVILEPGELDVEHLRESWATLSTVPAVRDDRICPLWSHGISRPGPGAPEAALEMARCLYPGRFGADPP